MAENNIYKSPVFLALDHPDHDKCLEIALELRSYCCGVKLGLEYYLNGNGSTGVKQFTDNDLKVFLDLKLHDIPNTVYKAVRAVANIGCDYLTVHAQGGYNMLEKAVQSVQEHSQGKKLKLLAVTLLTSLDDNHLHASTGLRGLTSRDYVLRLTDIAFNSGVDGIVCSPHELQYIPNDLKNELEIFTPGIRFDTQDKSDQVRTMTPQEALANGSDHLVMGRSIIGKENAKELLCSIANLQ